MAVSLRVWIETLRPRVVVECGAHHGEDTTRFAAVASEVHAFEADPRNVAPADLPGHVRWNAAAVSDCEGERDFTPSATIEDGIRVWTESGSLRAPREHLVHYPTVTFGPPVRVRTVTLDGYCRGAGVESVDLLWADVQGAELDMLRGAEATIARTSWMALEVSDHELYAGQARRAEIVAWLAERGWRFVVAEGEGTTSPMALFVNERRVAQWRDGPLPVSA